MDQLVVVGRVGQTRGLRMPNSTACLLVGLAVVGFASATARGQGELERFDRQLEQIQRQTRLLIDRDVPLDQRARFEYGGFVSLGFFAIDDPDANTHILRQPELHLYSSINLDGAHEIYLRGSTVFRDFNTGDSFDDRDDDFVHPRLDRGFYRFNLQRAMQAYQGETTPFNLIVEGGRNLVHWGNGLTLSQEIDGGQVTIEWQDLTITGLGGRTRGRFSDIDSSRPGSNVDMERDFWGGLVRYQAAPKHEVYIYGLVQQDRNPDRPLMLPVPTSFRYDSHYIGVGSSGSFGDRLGYGIEAVYQGGNGLSNSFTRAPGGGIVGTSQTAEDIEAFAVNARLDYLFQDAHLSRLSGEVLIASGDDDRESSTDTFGGNRSGTDDHSFIGFGLLNTGLAFAPEASNLLMLRLGASTYPLRGSSELFKRLQVGMDFFVFNKLDGNAPIDEPTFEKTFLGLEPDVYANWQITSDVAVIMRYGVFFPSSAFPGDRDPRHFFYTGVTYAF